MKKFALLLSLALLAACGGSGGTSSTGVTPSTPAVGTTGQTGTLTLKINEPLAKMGSADQTTTSTSKTMRRIIVTNPNILNSAGKVVQFTLAGGDYDVNFDYDAVAPGINPPALTIANIPVASGYSVEIVDYQKSTTTTVFGSYSVYIFGTSPAQYILRPGYSQSASSSALVKYAGAKFDMTASGASVSLTPVAPVASVAPATTFHGGIPSAANLSYQNLSTLYKMQATLPEMTPFKTSWALKQGYTAAALTKTTNINGLVSADLTGPTAYDASNVFYPNYFSAGSFYLKDNLLLPGENATDFSWTTGTISSILFTKVANFN